MTEMESYAKISGSAPDYFFLCRSWFWAESASYGKTSYSGNDEAHDCAFKRKIVLEMLPFVLLFTRREENLRTPLAVFYERFPESFRLLGAGILKVCTESVHRTI